MTFTSDLYSRGLALRPVGGFGVTVHSPIEFEVISGHFVRKSRGLRREMLQMQHFCASRSVVTFTTCKGVNSNGSEGGIL